MARPDILACTPFHPLPDGEVHVLGAVDCVTGAMTRVDIGGRQVLVDCGVGQGREAQRWTFPDAARDVDAVVLTHGHLDHIGSLPMLLDSDLDVPLLATSATLDIARLSLEDALELQRASRREIEWFLNRFDRLRQPIAYDVSSVGKRDVSLTFREAGHILGSSSVELRSAQSRVVISGDLGRPNSPILKDAFTGWADDRPVDFVLMESTYGSRDHEHSHDDIEGTLLEVVRDVVAKRGKLFIPAFAIGRTQVLLWFLNALVESGKIPAVPVAIDTPMGLVVTETYQKFRRLFDQEAIAKLQRGDDPLDFENLFAVNRGRDSWKLVEASGPMIVIAGSGMVSGGRIIRHLVDGLPDPKNTLLFVGHQSVGTNGRRIQEHAKDGRPIWLDGQEIPIRASIKTLRGLSAHADRGELAAWLSHIPAVRRVGLHHGEESAQHDLVRYMTVPRGQSDDGDDGHTHNSPEGKR